MATRALKRASKTTPSKSARSAKAGTKSASRTRGAAKPAAKQTSARHKPGKPSKAPRGIRATRSSPAANTQPRSEPEPKARPSREDASSRRSKPAGAVESVLDTLSSLHTAQSEIAANLDALTSHVVRLPPQTGDSPADKRAAGPLRDVEDAELDRAASTFRRLVDDLVSRRVGDVVRPLIALRLRTQQRLDECRADNGAPTPPACADLLAATTCELDQVLDRLGLEPFQPQPGDFFDPLIHLAVDETCDGDHDDGAITHVVQPGYRSHEGKIATLAKVKVNRR